MIRWLQELWSSNTEPKPAPVPRPPPAPREQVEALLTNRVYDLVARHLGMSSFPSSSYAQVFTLTREEIAEHIQKQVLVLEDYSAKYHGLWLLRTSTGWAVQQYYPPEKCPAEYIDTPFSSEAEARRELFRRVLRNTQTGLYL